MEFHALSNYTGLIIVDGNLGGENEDDLKIFATRAMKQGMKNIVLDFRPLDHVNSAGASALVKLAVSAKQLKLRLFSFGLNDRYQEIFSLTGLSEGITFLQETSVKQGSLSDTDMRQLKEKTTNRGVQNDSGWAPNLTKLQVIEKPEGAINKNVDGRRVLGPLQGFGIMWQKTYLLTINRPGLQPKDVITILKQHFPEFQPIQNTFYPSSKGIAAGEIVLIDSLTPGGIVSTGVLVLYADDSSFTFVTPQGHPEAGWVTFSARKQGDTIEIQIQGLARASDPLYELAFRIAGAKLQETIWKRVLSSLASYLGVEPDVRMIRTCVASDLQWARSGNLWHNAQIRSLPHNIPYLFRRPRRKSQ